MYNFNILITENQYSKLIESQENESDTFWRSNFDSETKTVNNSYYLWDENSDSYKILNFIEKEKPTTWYSGDKDYLIYPKSVVLPKKFVEKLDAVPNREGYFVFRIPYWLYKKEDNLAIRRIPTKYKKFSLSNIDDKFYKMLDNPKFYNALLGMEIKKEILDRLQQGHKKSLEVRANKESSKETSQSSGNLYPFEKENQVWKNINSSSSDPDSTDQFVQEN